jgi:hypothetical protein
VVIGSQAILGQFPDAPDDLLASIEADVHPRAAPDKSDSLAAGDAPRGSALAMPSRAVQRPVTARRAASFSRVAHLLSWIRGIGLQADSAA